MNSLGPWGYSHISLPQHNGELIPRQASKFERIRHIPVAMKHECHKHSIHTSVDSYEGQRCFLNQSDVWECVTCWGMTRPQ